MGIELSSSVTTHSLHNVFNIHLGFYIFLYTHSSITWHALCNARVRCFHKACAWAMTWLLTLKETRGGAELNKLNWMCKIYLSKVWKIFYSVECSITWLVSVFSHAIYLFIKTLLHTTPIIKLSATVFSYIF